MTTEQQLTKAQLTALELLANPGKNSLRLLFCKPELFTVGAVFIQLVDLGYAHESRIHSGWVKFAITPEGKKKYAEVQGEQTR